MLNQSQKRFSTAKAFQIANDTGQKIFFITQENMNEILPQLNHRTGYRIFNPITGDSADMISGGLNGGIQYAIGFYGNGDSDGFYKYTNYLVNGVNPLTKEEVISTMVDLVIFTVGAIFAGFNKITAAYSFLVVGSIKL